MCLADNATHVRMGADQASRVLTVVTASLSIFGSLFIIITYVMWRDIRTISRLLLVLISLADLLTSAGNLFGAVAPDHMVMGSDVCSVQSLITTTSCLSFIMWTTIMAVYLYLSIVWGFVRPSYTARYVSAVFGWVIPLSVTIFAYLLDVLGDDQSAASAGWCWLKSEPRFPEQVPCADARLMWSLLTAKGWEIPSYIVVPILYVLAKRHISKERRSMSQTLLTAQSLQAAVKVNRKLAFVPMAYVLLRMWGSIRYVLEVSGANISIYEDHKWLYWFLLYMHAIGDNGQGFANFILFCVFTKAIRNKLVSKAAYLCLVCRNNAGETTPLLGHRPHLANGRKANRAAQRPRRKDNDGVATVNIETQMSQSESSNR